MISKSSSHAKEMVHQDLRPEKIMIAKASTVKIIDFGSTRAAGVVETGPGVKDEDILGTLQYTAPEYFIGDKGNRCSDFFSLGVITYQMMTGKLPYGMQVSKIRTRKEQRKLRDISAQTGKPQNPDWTDGMLKKSVHPDPYKRYESLSEFIADLRTPNNKFVSDANTLFAERNPVAMWQILSLVLGLVIVLLITKIFSY